MARTDRDEIFNEFLAGHEVTGWQAERYVGTDVLTRLVPHTVWARQHAHAAGSGEWTELPPVGKA